MDMLVENDSEISETEFIISQYMKRWNYLKGFKNDDAELNKWLSKMPVIFGPSYRLNILWHDPIVKKKIKQHVCHLEKSITPVKFMRRLNAYNFVEIYLNNVHIFYSIPEEVFECPNLRVLSVKKNGLKRISANIGKLRKLEVLELTDNRLTTESLPYTLIFCERLHTLYLDNNNMISLPGFLLSMSNLGNLRRLSKHFTIRDIFDLNLKRWKDRITEQICSGPRNLADRSECRELKYLAARSVMASKVNYLLPNSLPLSVQQYISQCYNTCIICENCNGSCRQSFAKNYLVYTVREDYLGNSWTLFAMSACSLKCAQQLKDEALKIEAAFLPHPQVTNKFNIKESKLRCRKARCCIL